jgi:hypothetical protein
MTVELINRRFALFIPSIALLGTLAFSVPAARFPPRPPGKENAPGSP